VKINPTAKHGAFETTRTAQAECVSTSTALVPIERLQRAASSHRHVLTRPSASFVTHLIATAEQAPQTRTLRRATPADALAAYGRITEQAAVVMPNIENLSRVA
jgi:RNA polymerase-interacting CarD/CdnL/TRCF family regulator